MSTPNAVSEATFAAEVLEAELPVVVDFGAPWCSPCRAIEPSLRDLAAEFEGRLLVRTVNVDDNPSLAARYEVVGLPTLVFFQGGREVQRVRGAAPKPVLRKSFEQALAATAATPV